MKKLAIVFASLILSGCATEKDDRICLDWRTVEITKQKCIPVYGNLICADETVVRNICELYHVEPLKEEENAS